MTRGEILRAQGELLIRGEDDQIILARQHCFRVERKQGVQNRERAF